MGLRDQEAPPPSLGLRDLEATPPSLRLRTLEGTPPSLVLKDLEATLPSMGLRDLKSTPASLEQTKATPPSLTLSVLDVARLDISLGPALRGRVTPVFLSARGAGPRPNRPGTFPLRPRSGRPPRAPELPAAPDLTESEPQAQPAAQTPTGATSAPEKPRTAKPGPAAEPRSARPDRKKPWSTEKSSVGSGAVLEPPALTEADILILGGDFNCTTDDLDRNHAEPHVASRKRLWEVMEAHKLSDIWRIFNKNKRQYTGAHAVDNSLPLARLDRFYSFKHQLTLFTQCFIVPYTLNVTRDIVRSLKALEIGIVELQHLEATGDRGHIEALKSKKAKMNDLLDITAQGALVRSRFKSAAKMDAPSKFFFSLEQKNGQKSSEWSGAQVVEDSFLVGLPKLSERAARELDRELSLEELHEALQRMENGRASGIDGLPAEFYKAFWAVIGQDVLDVLRDSILRGELPLSCRRAVLTLLPKKGDLTHLKNWRPVSLLCTDYKLLSKALASRLTKYTGCWRSLWYTAGDWGISGVTVPALSRTLVSSGIVTLRELVNVAGGRLVKGRGPCSAYGTAVPRGVVNQLLHRWRSALTSEERVQLMDYQHTETGPAEDESFPRLNIAPDLDGCAGPPPWSAGAKGRWTLGQCQGSCSTEPVLRTWVLQQDNDPKHTSKSTSEWLKKNKMKTLEWPSQSPDLNPIAMQWHDLKKVVHARKPSNVDELQQFCKDEWAKIPPQRCNRLIASYGKRLIAVVAAKGGPTSY
ncbi:hypothetical protein QTP86_031670 [Hemibagrus guttatus]|nr:hypothetical protein QTP86_031670 [Hemibagrus guttatus]